MELREQLNGIQHVGIPTNDIEMTIAFYEKLGFIRNGELKKSLKTGLLLLNMKKYLGK